MEENRTMKIIAMLPVKNEAWCLKHCLQSLTFCDEILAIDDKSTDATPSILKEFGVTVLPFETTTKIGWKEYAIRAYLLAQARARGATHIVAIDGDEMFSDSFVRDARDILIRLRPGESLSLPWINVCDQDMVMEPTISKVFLMADDSHSIYQEGFIHIPRVPSAIASVSLDAPYTVLHFQYLNKRRNEFKKIWYMMSELLKGSRGALRINASYSVTKDLVAHERDLAPFTTHALPNPNTDNHIWQESAVATLFDEHGYLRFERLDIWDLPELESQFEKLVGRKPHPYIPHRWLLKLNNLKNEIYPRLRSIFQK